MATITTAGTYTVTVTSANGCTATATTTVTLEPLPNAPTVSSTTIGSGNTATLTASGCLGTVRWYAGAASTSILATGNSFTSPTLTASTTYFADCLSATNCVSATRGSGTVTISGSPCPSIQTLSNTEVSPTNTKYEASEKVISTSKINAGATIVYDGGKVVELNPGFEAKAGSVFKVQIDGCGNN